jgi:ABC-type transport system involved in Fe-S cluster assembly fused permease/ATPase subunit
MANIGVHEIILKFLPFLWRNKSLKLRLEIIAAILLIPFTIALNLILPFIFKQIINSINYKINTTESTLIILILSYSILWTLETCTTKIREMVFFRPICRAITDYSITVFKHLHDLNLRFHLSRETGKITTAIDGAQRAIAMVITNILFRITPAIIAIALAFIIIGYLYGAYYVSVLFCTLIIFIICGYITNNIVDRLGNEWANLDSYATSKLVDSLLNIETVKYFDRTQYEIANATKLQFKIGALAIKSATILRSIQIALICIIALGLWFVTYHTAAAVLQHKLLLGDFILISSYVILFLGPMYELSMLISDTLYYATRISPAASLLAETNALETKESLPDLQINNGAISFENVYFGYNPEISILRDLSFSIPAGSTCAIVGPSGCGKSTISRLLLRFFEPINGCIKIDKQIIENCNPHSVRQAISCVPQDIALFNNTMRFNICYGTFNCSDLQLNEILHITELEKFVQNLPDGLNTKVGERGLKLSGGERQRVALARALLKHSKILVLDEATSALDVNTELAINTNLAAVSKDTTILIIAHRLSTIVDADQIIVLENGSIAEQGSHHQLLKSKGLYYQLWQQQENHEQGIT